MAGNLAIPRVFAAGGQKPASYLDDNNVAIRDYVNNREVATGTFAARPAAGVAGRWYVATDVNGGTAYVDTGSVWVQVAASVTGATAQMFRGYLAGLGLANNATDATNDLDVAVGQARSDDDTEDLVLGTAITKRLDAAWVVGNNEGGRDTGAIADGWWYVFLIKRPDTGVVDVLFSASPTSPTMPTNYTKKRRLGAMLRASGVLVPFFQYGDRVMRSTPILDASALTISAGAGGTDVTLSVPRVDGLEVLVNAQLSSSGGYIYFRHPAWADPGVASGTVAPLSSVGATAGQFAAAIRVYPDATGVIKARSSNGSESLHLVTLGWIDRRGRDA